MTIRCLNRLLMILGGKAAAEFRVLIEGVFSKVMSGDQSLIEVINENAASNAPLQQAYRQALAQEPVVVSPAVDELSLTRKRQLEREDALFEMEMAERKERLLRMSAETKVKMTEAQVKLERDVNKTLHERMEMYKSLCPNKVIDDRAKLMFKDTLMNITSQSAFTVSTGSQLAIGNGFEPSFKPMTISVIALKMGYRLNKEQLMDIGREMAERYREKYAKKPEKHPQEVGGAVIDVNSYYEKDHDMLKEVIEQYLEGAASGEQGKKGKKGGKKSEDNGQKKIQSFMSSRQQMDV
jgi:hypothetical protein